MSSETCTCAAPLHVLERSADDRLHAEPVDLGDRVHVHPRRRRARRARPGRARGCRSGRCDPRRPTGDGQRPPEKCSPSQPSAPLSPMPCTLPDGVVSGVLQSACASNQIVADRAVDAREPAEDPERERMVAAEHERQLAGAATPTPRARRSGRRRRGSGRDTSRAHRPRRAPRCGPRRRCRGRARRVPGRRGGRAGRRSGSPTVPCRRRDDPARGRVRRRGRRRAGVALTRRPYPAPAARARRRALPAPARTPARRPPAAGSGTHDAARLAHEQVARGVIPLGQTVLVEGVEAPGCDPREVERGRAGAADVARPRQHPRDQRGL